MDSIDFRLNEGKEMLVICLPGMDDKSYIVSGDSGITELLQKLVCPSPSLVNCRLGQRLVIRFDHWS